MSMANAETVNVPDLRNTFPRSPNALVGPYVLLARILDKCRATLAGTNGEYSYNCPLDRRFFDFFQIDAEAFKAEVAAGQSDEAMLAWVNARVQKTEMEILTWAYQQRTAKPTEPDKMAYFEKIRREVAPTYTQLETWFALLDAEEGRI